MVRAETVTPEERIETVREIGTYSCPNFRNFSMKCEEPKILYCGVDSVWYARQAQA
jgi:hypothetical protein